MATPGDAVMTRGGQGGGPSADEERGLWKARRGRRGRRGASGAKPRPTTRRGAGRNLNPRYGEDAGRRGRRPDLRQGAGSGETKTRATERTRGFGGVAPTYDGAGASGT